MNPQSVVLVGRPNVGKSTLFNRLTRSRTAITDPTPGVTRDCIEKKMAIGDNEIILVDTGGFKMERQGELEEAVYNHAVAKIETSGCVVLILEGGELSAEDEELILMLRPHIKKIIVAVNKCEGGRNESDAWNYLKFGFEKILFISAEHGDNIGLLVNDISEKLFSDKQSVIYNKTVSEDAPVKIAIVGKPNTGKSTLSNLLLRRAASIVSNVAGTTRDVIEGEFHYKNKKIISYDTAGIRRKGKVNENIEYYSVNRAIKAIENTDIIILLIDAVEGLTEQDKKIAALATKAGRGIILVLNKWDLKEDIKNQFKAEIDRIHFFFGQLEYAPILKISAKNEEGITELLNTVLKMHGQLTRQIETSTLNEALARWQEESPPPQGPRTRFSIKYGTQTSVNPVRLTLSSRAPMP